MDINVINPSNIPEFLIYPLDGDLVLAIGLFCLNALGYWIFITYLQSKADRENLMISKLRFDKMSNLKVIKLKRMYNGKTDQENLDSILKHFVQTKASIKRYDFDLMISLVNLREAIPGSIDPIYIRPFEPPKIQKHASSWHTLSYDTLSTIVPSNLHHQIIKRDGTTINDPQDVRNLVLKYCPDYDTIYESMQECIDNYHTIRQYNEEYDQNRVTDMDTEIEDQNNDETHNEDLILNCMDKNAEEKKKLLTQMNTLLCNKDKLPYKIAANLQKLLKDRSVKTELDRKFLNLLRDYYIDFCDLLSLSEDIMKEMEEDIDFNELLSRLRDIKRARLKENFMNP